MTAESAILKAYAVIAVLWAVSIAAWLTHVIVCIKTSSFLFLIAGAIVAPVGVIHGVGVWFGAW